MEKECIVPLDSTCLRNFSKIHKRKKEYDNSLHGIAIFRIARLRSSKYKVRFIVTPGFR